MSALEQKKEEKRQALLDSAYNLFMERGTTKTSISDIAERARVAKGTFYLYFQDKDAVMNTLLSRISEKVLREAYAHLQSLPPASFADHVISFVDYIIEYFKREKLVLRFVQRNFNWNLMEKELSDNTSGVFAMLRDAVKHSPEMAGRTEDEMKQRLFLLLEMCSSTCYSCIIEGKPASIDDMKPVLYDIIRKAL